MSDRAQSQTFGQQSLDFQTEGALYRQDGMEFELPSQPSDPARNPGITDDLATIASRQEAEPEQAAEIDLTVGVGEDPGWHRARRRRRWREPAERTAYHNY